MTLSRIHIILACLTCLLGMVHIACAFPIEYWDKQTLWFIGAGMAIVYAGLMNLITANSTSRFARIVCGITDLVTACLFLAALLAMQEIQVFIGFALFAAQGILAFGKKSA